MIDIPVTETLLFVSTLFVLFLVHKLIKYVTKSTSNNSVPLQEYAYIDQERGFEISYPKEYKIKVESQKLMYIYDCDKPAITGSPCITILYDDGIPYPITLQEYATEAMRNIVSTIPGFKNPIRRESAVNGVPAIDFMFDAAGLKYSTIATIMMQDNYGFMLIYPGPDSLFGIDYDQIIDTFKFTRERQLTPFSLKPFYNSAILENSETLKNSYLVRTPSEWGNEPEVSSKGKEVKFKVMEEESETENEILSFCVTVKHVGKVSLEEYSQTKKDEIVDSSSTIVLNPEYLGGIPATSTSYNDANGVHHMLVWTVHKDHAYNLAFTDHSDKREQMKNILIFPRVIASFDFIATKEEGERKMKSNLFEHHESKYSILYPSDYQAEGAQTTVVFRELAKEGEEEEIHATNYSVVVLDVGAEERNISIENVFEALKPLLLQNEKVQDQVILDEQTITLADGSQAREIIYTGSLSLPKDKNNVISLKLSIILTVYKDVVGMINFSCPVDQFDKHYPRVKPFLYSFRFFVK